MDRQSVIADVESAPARVPDRLHAFKQPAKTSRWGVLRHKHFRWVWIGAFGSAVGTWMEHVGVQWLMAQQTGSASMMGYLALAQFGPMLLLGMLGGLVADQVDRRKMLINTQFMLMAIAAGLTVASAIHAATPTVLIVLSLLNGIVTAFNVPAWQVLTPRLVPRNELANAIALNGLQFNLARAIGPALGGLLMASSSATVLFAFNTVSFLGVIAAVWHTPSPPNQVVTTDERRGWFASATILTREALVFVFKRRGPMAVFLGMVVFSTLAGGTVLRMLPLFVSEVYGISESKGEAAYGLLLALMGLGAVCGALALKWIPTWYPRHHFIPLAILGGGISIVVYSFVTNFVLACVIMVIVGVFWIWAFNSSMAAMQLLVSDAMRGRVMAVMNMVVFGAAPLGTIGAAYLGEAIAGHRADGNPTGLAVQIGVGGLASLLVVAGAVMLTWRTPEVDGIQPGEAGYERRPGFWRGVTARAHRPVRVVQPVGINEAPGQELP